MKTKTFVWTAAVGALAAVYACVTTPVTDRRALNLIPASQMTSLGAEAYREVLAKEKISHDPALNETLRRVGERIAKASGADFQWEFAVIDDSKTVNAFALPGGKIAVYTGLLPVARTEAGLAAVLGHEVAHATANHGGERMSQALVANLGLSVAQITLSDSKYRGTILGLLGLGTQLGVMLPYSRLHENEADEIGLTYMARAGYDPREAVALWQRMAAEGGSHPPEFLATHPNPETRMKRLSEEMPAALALYEKSDKQPSRSVAVAY